MDFLESFAEETRQQTDKRIKKAKFDKTVKGLVTKSLGNNEYVVRINGAEYNCHADCLVNVNDTVYATLIQNSYNDILITKPNAGGESTITVDASLSTESANPVQNKVITSALNDMQAERDTTENWNARLSYRPAKNKIIIYTDYTKNANEQDVPNIKIGDGDAYLIDLPFVYSAEEALDAHIADSVAHITATERTFWNNKINLELDGTTLIFNRN